MMHVVTGGSGSGKSAYAEQLVQEYSGKSAYAEEPVQERAEDVGHEKVLHRIYIATMIPYGEEGARRVARHRRMRQEKQFETIECYTGLSRLRIPERSVVLLECVSNLTANEMYDLSGAGEGTVRAVVDGIQSLHRQAEHLVIVTNEIFSDGITYDASTMQYMAYLGEINQEIAREADRVTEVVYGIPVGIKDVEDDVRDSGQD